MNGFPLPIILANHICTAPKPFGPFDVPWTVTDAIWASQGSQAHCGTFLRLLGKRLRHLVFATREYSPGTEAGPAPELTTQLPNNPEQEPIAGSLPPKRPLTTNDIGPPKALATEAVVTIPLSVHYKYIELRMEKGLLKEGRKRRGNAE